MGEYTTVQLTKRSKNKLDLMKGTTNASYSDVIEKLVKLAGGTPVDDVITIDREPVAMTLNYFTGTGETKKRDITYKELKSCKVGDLFVPCDEPNYFDSVTCTAKVVYKHNDDVILLVREYHYKDNMLDSVSSVVHVNTF
ncbi:hypothetical protein [Methanobrevibacter sp.]